MYNINLNKMIDVQRVLGLKNKYTNILSLKNKYILHLNGDTIELKNLCNKVIENKNILLSQFHYAYPYRNKPIFINANNLFVLDCHRHFIEEWIDPTIFPNIQNLYLCSKVKQPIPLEQKFLHIPIHLEKSYSYCMKSNNKFSPNVILITLKDIEILLSQYDKEYVQIKE
jgi:hypothetical protein